MTRLAGAATVLLGGLGLGGLGLVLSLLYDAGVPVAVCLAGGVLVSAGAAALTGLPTEDTGDMTPDSQPGTEQRSSFGDLHTLQTRLASAGEDTERFEDRVRRPLADLTAELLRQRHRLDWRARPDEARAVLGTVLWPLLTAPRGRFPASRQQAQDWVAAVEQLASAATGPRESPSIAR